MATITTDTFLDGGVARTAGEARTMNGGILTIRTDTRWHADAPASMTGSIGATTTSAVLGGGLLIDSTNVRRMPYNNGSSTVPAIGTSITQGGVSGYLLGVWADYVSAPTAVGASMPSTGYIKFREVTGGAFTAGALTGIGADATAPDRQGRIEIAQENSLNTVPRLGFYRTRGGWFELDQVTSGSPNDVIQIPTNGGGAGTHVPAVWIETTPGSNLYDRYPAMLSTRFNATNLSTDDRCKFVQTLGNGQIRIGWDGASNAGYVPPAGCKIRVPSNIGRATSSANRALNLAPQALASRPRFTTTSAGVIDMEFFMNDRYHLFSAPYSVTIKNCATFDVHSTTNEATPTLLENYCNGNSLSSVALIGLNNSVGGIIRDCKFFRANAVSNGHCLTMTGCFNYEFEGLIETGVIEYARSSGNVVLTQCGGFSQVGIFSVACATFLTSTVTTSDFERIRYIDRLNGTTNATTGKYAISTSVSSADIIIRNVDFGGYSNVHPYLGVFASGNCTNITVREGGSFLSPLGGATNAPAYIYQDSGNNDGIRVQNIFLTATRTSPYITINTSKNQVFERLGGTVGTLQNTSINTLAKGTRSAANSTTGSASVYGTHTSDMFDSDTTGRIRWAMNEPTADTAQYVTLTLTGATGGFTSGGQVALPAIGDSIDIETPYYMLGHTGFVNIAPTLTGTGTGNFLYQYDIDTGGGFTGVYQTLNGANLSAEVVSPTTGFKLRLRASCTVANSTNAITYIRINTTSTAIAQQNIDYPLEVVNSTLTITGMDVGSEVVLFDSSNNELKREVVTGDFVYNYIRNSNDGDSTGNYFIVWKDDKKVLRQTGITLDENGVNIGVTQEEDLLYQAGSTIVSTLDGPNKQQLLTVQGDVEVSDIYSNWKDWVLLSNNAQYQRAYTNTGGDAIGTITSIPGYVFQINGWKLRLLEANGITNIVGGVIVGEAGADPFVDTVGAFTARVNFQQPVQAITVSTGGVTPADVWSHPTRELTDMGIADLTVINDGVKKASKLIPHSTNL